jgi:hypothetical protein
MHSIPAQGPLLRFCILCQLSPLASIGKSGWGLVTAERAAVSMPQDTEGECRRASPASSKPVEVCPTYPIRRLAMLTGTSLPAAIPLTQCSAFCPSWRRNSSLATSAAAIQRTDQLTPMPERIAPSGGRSNQQGSLHERIHRGVDVAAHSRRQSRCPPSVFSQHLAKVQAKVSGLLGAPWYHVFILSQALRYNRTVSGTSTKPGGSFF